MGGNRSLKMGTPSKIGANHHHHHHHHHHHLIIMMRDRNTIK